MTKSQLQSKLEEKEIQYAAFENEKNQQIDGLTQKLAQKLKLFESENSDTDIDKSQDIKNVQLALDKLQSEKVTHFVYPFLESAADWKEILYSIRSIEKNYQGSFKIFIVGDLPEELDQSKVTFISSPGTSHKDGNQPLDIVVKLQKVVSDERINDDFIWMNDDIYFVNPVFYEDIAILKAVENLEGLQRNENTPYRKNLWNTFDLLKQNKCSLFNYGTHLPFVYNKEKMSELIKRFNLKNEALLISSLYHNYFFSHAKPFILNVSSDNIKIGIYKKNPNFTALSEFLTKKKFFNHSVTGFSENIQNILENLFPEKSRFEK